MVTTSEWALMIYIFFLILLFWLSNWSNLDGLSTLYFV